MPPAISSASKIVTSWPSIERSWAAAIPAEPAPTIAIRLPDGVNRFSVIRWPDGLWSAAARLRWQMLTGVPLPGQPWRQASSQGREQIRPSVPGSTLAIRFNSYERP